MLSFTTCVALVSIASGNARGPVRHTTRPTKRKNPSSSRRGAGGRRSGHHSPSSIVNLTYWHGAYDWQPPWVSMTATPAQAEPTIHIRGLMNTGTNFLNTILGTSHISLSIMDQRKHMLPWVTLFELTTRYVAATRRSSSGVT